MYVTKHQVLLCLHQEHGINQFFSLGIPMLSVKPPLENSELLINKTDYKLDKVCQSTYCTYKAPPSHASRAPGRAALTIVQLFGIILLSTQHSSHLSKHKMSAYSDLFIIIGFSMSHYILGNKNPRCYRLYRQCVFKKQAVLSTRLQAIVLSTTNTYL